MKLILALSLYLSVALARLVDPAYYQHQQGYNSHEKDTEADKSYYSHAGLSSGGYYPLGGRVYNVRPSYVISNGYPRLIGNGFSAITPAVLGGSAYDVNQYYNSKQAASESDQVYYDRSAVMNGGVPSINYLPNGVSVIPSNIGNALDVSQYYNSKQAASESDQTYFDRSQYSDAGVPQVYYVSNRIPIQGNAYDTSQYYNSKKAQSESDQTYFDSVNANSGSFGPASFAYLPNYIQSYGPVLPNRASLGVGQFYNSKTAANELDQTYYGNSAINNAKVWPVFPYSEGYFPASQAYDVSQYYNSVKAASESDQMYYDRSAFNNVHPWRYASYVPNGFTVIPPNVGGSAHDVTKYYNSQKAASESDESYYGNAGQSWLGVPTWSTYAYSPVSDQRVHSENFRDSQSQSLNDQSTFLNNYLATDNGVVKESLGSQSSSSNQESDTSYNHNDFAQSAYSPFVYNRVRF